MVSRDDMVFIPRIGRQARASAPGRAFEERKLDAARRRSGVLSRMVKASAARRLIRKRSRARSGARRVAASKGVARKAAGFSVKRAAVGTAARAAVANPIGLILVGLLVAGVVALRLATDQKLEGLGEELNHMFLGDIDEKARASIAVRKRFQADKHLARIVGQEGKANSQIKSIAADLRKDALEKQHAATLFRRTYPVNNTIDMLILRAAALWKGIWASSEVPAKAEKAMKKFGKLLPATRASK